MRRDAYSGPSKARILHSNMNSAVGIEILIEPGPILTVKVRSGEESIVTTRHAMDTRYDTDPIVFYVTHGLGPEDYMWACTEIARALDHMSRERPQLDHETPEGGSNRR